MAISKRGDADQREEPRRERPEVGSERCREREDRSADRAVEGKHESPADADPAREPVPFTQS